MERYRTQLRAQLTAVADKKRAITERAYLKTPERFSVLGVSMPRLRRITKTFAREHHAMPAAEVIALSRALYFSDSQDERFLAIGILEYRRGDLGTAVFDTLVDFVRDAYTWAQVDWIGTDVASPLVVATPSLQKRLPKLAKDDVFWVRRLALLSLNADLRREAKHFALFTKLATPMLGETEFFIRKAIGWMLRETAKRHPELVHDYVREHVHAMSGLTFRESTRLLPVPMRAKLQALRDSG